MNKSKEIFNIYIYQNKILLSHISKESFDIKKSLRVQHPDDNIVMHLRPLGTHIGIDG